MLDNKFASVIYLLYLLSALDSETRLFSIAYLWYLSGQSVSQLDLEQGLNDLGSESGYQPVQKLLFGVQMPFKVPLWC